MVIFDGLILIGLAVALFVGFNIGGGVTPPAFWAAGAGGGAPPTPPWVPAAGVVVAVAGAVSGRVSVDSLDRGSFTASVSAENPVVRAS